MGTFLTILGTIVLILAGGCTVLFVSDTNPNDPFFNLVYLFGGVPMILGLGLLLVGIAVNKHKAKRASKDPSAP